MDFMIDWESNLQVIKLLVCKISENNENIQHNFPKNKVSSNAPYCLTNSSKPKDIPFTAANLYN